MDTLSRLQDIIRQVFDDESLVVSRETTAADVEAWDSVLNVSLMLEVERAFKIRLSTSEIAYLENVGGLVDLIDSKVKK